MKLLKLTLANSTAVVVRLATHCFHKDFGARYVGVPQTANKRLLTSQAKPKSSYFRSTFSLPASSTLNCKEIIYYHKCIINNSIKKNKT